jgi:streptogramin lyase
LIGELLGGLSGEVGARRPAWAPARAAGPTVISSAPAPRLPEILVPNGVAVDAQGRIYFTEGDSRRVVRMDDMDGRGAKTFGLDGAASGRFGVAGPLCLDAKGRVYVADPQLDRIVRLDDMDGSGCVSLGTTGSGEGFFNGVLGVCVDARGRIYVTDSLNNRIVRFDDMDGSGWVTLGGPQPGEGPGRFNLPHGIFVDPSGFIFVSVHPATVVRMNDMDGSGWVAIRPANLRLHHVRYTRGLAVDSERNAIYLVVGDSLNIVVRISGLTGLRWTALRAKPGASRSHPDLRDRMRMPMRVCIDSRQRLYITDPGLHRIVRVDDIYGNGWAEYPPPVTPPAPGTA